MQEHDAVEHVDESVAQHLRLQQEKELRLMEKVRSASAEESQAIADCDHMEKELQQIILEISYCKLKVGTVTLSLLVDKTECVCICGCGKTLLHIFLMVTDHIADGPIFTCCYVIW